jgi:hypothetical protein
MRKKEENIWLRKLWNLERKVVIRNPIIKRKVQIATNKAKKQKNKEIRNKWNSWIKSQKQETLDYKKLLLTRGKKGKKDRIPKEKAKEATRIKETPAN